MGHWYYGENGQQLGPMDESAIRTAMSDGRVTPQTLVWRDGMPNWQPLAQVPELSGSYLAPAAGYGAPYSSYSAYGPGAGATSGLAITSMICGIVGLVTCLIPIGIPAVICGHMALNQINNSPVPLGGRGMAMSGLIMGYIQVILMVVIAIGLVMSTFA